MKGSVEWEDGGRIFIKTFNDGVPHRRSIEPGDMGGDEGGVYQETDLSDENSIVKAVAAEVWTAALKAEWQAACEAAYERQKKAEAS